MPLFFRKKAIPQPKLFFPKNPLNAPRNHHTSTTLAMPLMTGHRSAIYGLAPGDVPGQFYSAGGEGWVVRWDLADPDNGMLTAQVEGNLFSICSVPDRPWLVAGNMYGGLHWIDWEKKTDFKNVLPHKKGVFDLQTVGPYLYSLGGDGTLCRWSAGEARLLETLDLSHKSLRALAVSPDGQTLAVGSSDGHVYLLDNDSLALRNTIFGAHQPSVFTLAFSPDGQWLLSGGRDAHLRAWNPRTGEKVGEIAAHWFTVNHLLFSPNGRWLATASRDKTVKLWDADTYNLLKVLDSKYHGHRNSVNRLFWAPDSRTLVSASDDRTLGVWPIG